MTYLLAAVLPTARAPPTKPTATATPSTTLHTTSSAIHPTDPPPPFPPVHPPPPPSTNNSWWPSTATAEDVARGFPPWRLDSSIYGALYREPFGSGRFPTGELRVRWGNIIWKPVGFGISPGSTDRVSQLRVAGAFPTALAAPLLDLRVRKDLSQAGKAVVVVSNDGELIALPNSKSIVVMGATPPHMYYQRQDVPLATRQKRAAVASAAPPLSSLPPLARVAKEDAHAPLLSPLIPQKSVVTRPKTDGTGGGTSDANATATTRLVNSTWIFDRMARAGVPLNKFAVNVGCNDGVTIDPVYELLVDRGCV